MFSFLKRGLKTIAAGGTQRSLGIQSPHLPNAIVRLGRFFYTVSGIWIFVAWYTGYANQRVDPGTGPHLILPGKPIIASVDRTSKTPGFLSNRAEKAAAKGASGVAAGVTAGINPVKTAAGTGRRDKSSIGAGVASVSAGPKAAAGSVFAGILAGAGLAGHNPVPGAVGGRLDQGFDMTSSRFNAPAHSKIIFASHSVSGWAGGGFVAGLILAGPKKGMVWYYAEGIAPTVQVGQIVMAGTQVGRPVSNPYNNIVGNIEAGWSNPASPTQPLAQVSTNKAAVAWDFYNWFRSLGGPTASQTGNAGLP